MANSAYTTLQIIPSIRGIEASLNKSLGSVGGIGKKAGASLGDSIAKGIETKKSAVDAAAQKVLAARTKEADAAGKVKVAEAQLQSLRDKGVNDAGRLAAAEEKVASAKRNSQLASERVADADKKLTTQKAALKRASDQAAGGLGEVDKRANRLGGTFSTLGGKIKGILPMLAGSVGLAGIGASFGAAIKVGNDLTNSLNTMKSVGNATEAQIAKVSETARQLGNDISLPATSATDAAAAMVELAKGGFSVDQAMKGAKGSLQLAAAAQIDATQAATVQSQMLQSFGKDAGYASNAADILANAANESSAEIMDVSQGMQQFGAVAHLFKVPMEDAAASLAMLANAGIQGSDAGTLMKSALLKLANPSDQASKSITALGLSVYDAQGKFVGLESLFGQLQAAQGRMSDEMYQFHTAGVFGSDAMRLSGIAAQQGAKGFDSMRDKMLKAGSAAKTAAAQTGGLPGALERAKNASEELLLKFYDIAKGPLENALNGFVKGLDLLQGAFSRTNKFVGDHSTELKVAAGVITAVFLPQLTVMATTAIWAGGQAVKGWLMNSGGAVKAAITSNIASAKIIAGWVAMGAGAVLNAAKIAGGWVLTGAGAVGATAKTLAYAAASGVVRAATLAWIGVQWLLNAALNANPIGIAVVAIAALVGGIILAYKKSETFRNIVHAVWNGIKTAVSATVNWFTQTAWPAIKGFFTKIGDVVGKVVGFIKRNWKLLLAIITGPIGLAVMLVTKNFDKIKAVATTVKDWISEKFTQVKDWVVGKFIDIVQFVTGVPQKIRTAASGMWDGIKETFKGVINWIIRAWNRLEFKIPSFEVFGKKTPSFTLGLPKIREFLDGGYTGNYPRTAIAGVVHGDEQVINSSSRRKIEARHPGALDYMNAHGEIPGYMGGGYVSPPGLSGGKIQTGNPPNIGLTTDLQRWMWDQIRAVFPSSTMMSGTRTASVGSGFDNHMGARAIDITDSSSVMMKIASWIADKFPGSLELIHGPGFARQIKNGKIVGDGGGESGFYAGAGRHDDHVHWAMEKIGSAVGAAVSDSSSGSAPDSSSDSGSKTYDYSGEDSKDKYDKDNTDAKTKYDQDVAALKAKYHIGTTNSDLKAAGGQITRDRIELDRQRDAEINAAGGDKDRIKAIRARYKPQYDALKTRRQDLTLQRVDRGAATEADKAAYKAAKEKLDQEYKDDKEARKKAYNDAKGGAGGDQKSYPTSISGWAGFAAQELVSGQVADMLGVFGISDEPPALKAFSELQNQVKVTDKNGKRIWGNYQPDDNSSSSSSDSGPKSDDTKTDDKTGDPKNYPYQVVKAAKDLGLTKLAATIGVATGLVESGDPMKMYANSSVPESLKFPHDAVGSDHDSLGIFQQRAGAWGSVAERMDAYKSAGWFFRALQRVPGWEQDPGGAAQRVQRSAFPDRYGQKLTRAGELVNEAKLFDEGGWLMPGQVGVNKTGQPEPILNRNQWADVSETINIARDRVGGGGQMIEKLEQIRQMLAQSGDHITVNGDVRDESMRRLQAAQDRKIRTKLGAR